MDGYIKLSNLALVVILALGAVCGVYLVLLLRNLNGSIKVIREILQDNKKNIDETLKNMPAISNNAAEITDTAKNDLKMLGAAIQEFGETAQLTAATAETVKTDILGRLKSLIGIIEYIVRLFNRKKKRETKSVNK